MSDDLQTKAAELLKKVVTVGLGTVFLTEEKLKSLVSDTKLPKEILDGILDSASKTRERFFGSLTKDLVDKIADNTDLSKITDEFLSKNKIRFSIEVDIVPKDQESTDQESKGKSES